MKMIKATAIFAVALGWAPISHASLILVDLEGGSDGGVLISIGGLEGEIVTGFDLHVGWSPGQPALGFDFDNTAFFISSHNGEGEEIFSVAHFENSLHVQASLLLDNAMIAAFQLPTIANNGGVLDLYQFILCAGNGFDPSCPKAPDKVWVTGKVYGAGGKIILSVSEPRSLALLGMGLVCVGLVRQTKSKSAKRALA